MAKYVKTEQGYIETADFLDKKMDKNNPTGTGSFSLNRKPGTVVGAKSHAEGNNATASASYSHAEGQNTTASGGNSHAEGNIATASGICSHAEGDSTKASGNSSHAEGHNATASGICSHAEGHVTTASGNYSHAEGQHTTASGGNSHAEGFYTKASSSSQHVQGKYNIEDSSDVYADIIGNGASESKRSNASTVDWSGNAWYAGNVYVDSTSGTHKDSGSKKLATEEYVDNSAANINIPTTLPNPKAITFTGAANASYDGSSEVSVKIPYVSGKMDKSNPTGTGSFSLNRKAGSTIGDYSHAEGYDTIASGIYSHAEGHFTAASGENSHAEGYSTKALEEGAHVEGYYTKASSSNQHVQGKYNIEDSSNVYADIIGNGTESKPSNAATVDWSGNAWYAGDVYVGSTSGTNKDEGSKKLATEEYVDNSTANIDIPTTLPNPNTLTFTGAVNASYDGSSEVSVEIPTSLSDLSEDATHRVVTDAEKAKWNAKSNFSGSYNDLTNKPTIPDVPVQSVNGKTGAVVLSAEDVGALPSSTVIPEALPNPNAITFTGAVEGTYDGSAPLSVKIPTVDDVLAALPAWEGGSY